jgi:hypothetical protein
MHLSSGDVDLLEPVNLREVDALARRIQAIVRNLDGFVEFKCGHDPAYQ